MIKLVKSEFTWRDGYTQCIIQNVILSLSIQQPFSRQICADLVFESNEDDIQSTLDQLLSRTAGYEVERPLDNFGVSLLAPSQKRDEIVRVHKYFDKNKKIHKRKFQQPELDYSNYLSNLPRNDYKEIDPALYNMNSDPYTLNSDPYASNSAPYDVNYDDLDDLEGLEDLGIPYDDLLLVKSYLESEREKELYKSKLSELFSLLPEDFQQLSDEPTYGYADDVQDPGMNWMGSNDIYQISQPGVFF